MKPLRRIVRVLGFLILAFGILTLLGSAALILQFETGWRLEAATGSLFVGTPDEDSFGLVALAGFVSGMFFVLVGAGALLISRFRLLRTEEEEDERSPRWTMPVVVLLFICGAGSIVLATVFAGMGDQFGDTTVGIVSYCMLIGVGLLFAAWGLKRARDAREQPDSGPSTR